MKIAKNKEISQNMLSEIEENGKKEIHMVMSLQNVDNHVDNVDNLLA